jgi:hypothetical protein
MPATVANPYVNLELKIPKQNFEDFDKYTSRFKSEDGSAKGSWGHPHFPGAGGLVALSLTESGWPFPFPARNEPVAIALMLSKTTFRRRPQESGNRAVN